MDDGGFEAWYRHEHARVVNSLYLVSGSVDVARDATDEAFTRAAARWPRVRAMDSPGGWVFTVALNLVRREIRRNAREREAHSRIGRPVAGSVNLPDADLWAAVASLPERQREAIVLRYVGDLTEPEIASVMGIARGTVASNLARARDALAATLATETEAEC
jgi:RNA polymerase sigma-70 factor, ECF subfamily